jgi:general secretion pathway protein G
MAFLTTIPNASRRRVGLSRGIPRAARRPQSGMTLLELIVSCAILLVLSSAALPIARYSILRQRERELRANLLEIREAIDRFNDAATSQKIRVSPSTQGYPPDLQTLVKGMPLASAPDQTIRFLRSIPIDPTTGKADWGLRSTADDFDSTHWGGVNVFDVYSTSTAIATDGTRYSDW